VKVFDVEIEIEHQGAELRTGMTANMTSWGEAGEGSHRTREAIFKKDEAEVVYVKKPEEPKTAEKGGLLSSVFAAGKKDARREAGPKDAWKEKFELKEIETGLAAVDKVRCVRASPRAWSRGRGPDPPQGEEGQ